MSKLIERIRKLLKEKEVSEKPEELDVSEFTEEIIAEARAKPFSVGVATAIKEMEISKAMEDEHSRKVYGVFPPSILTGKDLDSEASSMELKRKKGETDHELRERLLSMMKRGISRSPYPMPSICHDDSFMRNEDTQKDAVYDAILKYIHDNFIHEEIPGEIRGRLQTFASWVIKEEKFAKVHRAIINEGKLKFRTDLGCRVEGDSIRFHLDKPYRTRFHLLWIFAYEFNPPPEPRHGRYFTHNLLRLVDKYLNRDHAASLLKHFNDNDIEYGQLEWGKADIRSEPVKHIASWVDELRGL